MAENSTIEWTHHTANAWWGCVKVSPLCDHCYAERDSIRYGHQIFGPGSRRRFIKSVWTDVPKWDEAAKAAGEMRRVFWMSMGDIFEVLPEGHPDRADMAHKRMHAFFLMESTTNLHHLLLTKRISNVADLVPSGWLDNWPSHIRIGLSVGTQKDADRDIPRLLQLPYPNFLSMEPLLESVDLNRIAVEDRGPYEASTGIDALSGTRWWCSDQGEHAEDLARRIDWVITGGESGPQARPSHPDWFRQLRDQCVEAGVPFHFKQRGEWSWDYPGELSLTNRAETFKHGQHFYRIGKKAAGRMLDGRTWDEFPAMEGVTA